MKKSIGFILNFVFRIFPINDKKIVFESGRNKIDGNSKSIYLYLKKNYPNKYKLIFLVNKNEDITEIDKNDVVYYKTLKGFYCLATAKYWIKNESVGSIIKKRKQQIYIQTFHGHGPIKNGGFETNKYKKTSENDVMNHVKDWDIYISMCETDEDHIKNATGYNKKFERIGISSTDEIIRSLSLTEKEKELLKLQFNIPLNKKIILYAPTYREELFQKSTIDLPILKLKNLKDYVVLIRLHPLLTSKIDQTLFHDSNFINVCDVPDIVSLYPIADVLISDYSASIYEFALTNKKIILYPYDYDKYNEYPGFCINYKKVLPGPIVYDEESLYETIINIDKIYDIIKNDWIIFNKKYNYMNDGKATRRFVQLLINNEFERNDKDE